LTQAPLLSIIIIVAWQWLPFATLILLTALQSLDSEQLEAAEMDGAGRFNALLVHHAAASGARDHRGDPDPDDLPVSVFAEILGHHQWRAGHGLDHADLPRLPSRRCCSSTSAAGRPAASSRSSWPTSSPSS
jgi:hypothetical protein